MLPMRPSYFANLMFADLQIATSAKIYSVRAFRGKMEVGVDRVRMIDGTRALRRKPGMTQCFIVEYDPGEYGARLVMICDFWGKERVTELVYAKVTHVGMVDGPMVPIDGVGETGVPAGVVQVIDTTKLYQIELNKLRRTYAALNSGKLEKLATVFAPNISTISEATGFSESVVRGFFSGRSVSDETRATILRAIGVNPDTFDPALWDG